MTYILITETKQRGAFLLKKLRYSVSRIVNSSVDGSYWHVKLDFHMRDPLITPSNQPNFSCDCVKRKLHMLTTSSTTYKLISVPSWASGIFWPTKLLTKRIWFNLFKVFWFLFSQDFNPIDNDFNIFLFAWMVRKFVFYPYVRT